MMDCKDVSSSIKSGTGRRKDLSLLALFTQWQLHCLEKIKNHFRGEFPVDQEQILFDKINDQVKKLKHDLIQLDVEDLLFIQVSLAKYEVGRAVDFNKFLTESLLSTYYSISEKVENKNPNWKDKELLEKWKTDVQSLKKDTEIILSLDPHTKAKFEEFLKVARDVNSLYTIYSTIESSTEVFVQGNMAPIEEKRLVLQKILHDLGEYTKGTEDTPNLSLDVRKDLNKKGMSLDLLSQFRNLEAHQFFSVIECKDVEIKEIAEGFKGVKAVIESEISDIESNFIKSIIPQDGLQIGNRSLRDVLLTSGISDLVKYIDLIKSGKEYKSFPEKVKDSINDIYENATRMKSASFSSDVGSLIDQEKQMGAVTKYVARVNEKFAKRDELKEYSNLLDKLVSISPKEDKAILENSHNDLLEVKKAIDSLRSDTRDSLNDIAGDFLNKKVFEKIEVRGCKDGTTASLKDELQKYFDVEGFKEKLPLVEFANPKQKLTELLEPGRDKEDVSLRDPNRKRLIKVLKLDPKKAEKIGSPEPEVYENLVHRLKTISKENREKLLSYSLELKREQCVKLLEENLPALDGIYGGIVKDKFIPPKIYEDFHLQYQPKQNMEEKVKSFFLHELVVQTKVLRNLNVPHAIQSSLLNIYSTWEKAHTVLGLEEKSVELKKLRNYFSHGDILISEQRGKVLEDQLKKLKTKIADIEFTIESFGSDVFDRVLLGFKSGPIGEVLSSYRHSDVEGTTTDSTFSKVGLDSCARQRGRRSAERARSIIKCLFSKHDVENFSKGKVDENNIDKVKIDSEKFLTYVKNNPDEGKNAQLVKFIGDKGVEGDYRHLVERVIQDGGYKRYIQNERINVLYSGISQQDVSLINISKLKGRLVNAVGRIQLVRGIHGAILSCENGTVTDLWATVGGNCGQSVGGLVLSIASQPIEDVIVKTASEFVIPAGKFVGKMIPGTLGRKAQFAVLYVGVKFGNKIAKGVAGAVGGFFDIIEIGMSASKLVNCKNRENSDNPCGEKEIRDEIASISFSGVSFVAGVALAAASMPVAGVAVGLGLMVGQAVYSGISNIVEYKKYDTTVDENWRIFWHTIAFQPIPLDVQLLAERDGVVNSQAERAWKALNYSPVDVVAYGIGFGMAGGTRALDPGYGKILMNITDADTTSLSRVMPKPIRDAEMICLPRPVGEPYERKGTRKQVSTAVHYCANAMVIADKRRKQNGKIILYDLEMIANVGSVAVGSNTLNNQFLIFTGYAEVTGGSNTINRFVLFKPELFYGEVIGGRNATNIIDLSQSTGYKYEIEIGYHSRYPRVLQLKVNEKPLVYDDIDEAFDAFRYSYTGRRNKLDNVMCKYDFRRITSSDNRDILVDSGGGLSKDKRDIVDNCKKVVISPYTTVTGVENDYTFYITTSGYKAKDLYSEIDVEGTGTIIFPEINLLNDCGEIAYLSSSNTLSLKIGLAQGNQYTLDIRNYIDRGSNQTNFGLIDENGSNIIPKIGKSESSVTKVDSFELYAEHSLDSLEAAESYYQKILSSSKGYKVFGVVRGKLQNTSSGAFQHMVFGSSGRDVINCDQRYMFARGGDGADIYVVDSNKEKREIIIDNSSGDKKLDMLIMQGVFEEFSIQQCNLHFFNSDSTHVQVGNYLKESSYRHLVVMNSREETFIPYVQSMTCVGSSIEKVKLSPFFRATQTQNMFSVPKSFRGNNVVIDSRLEDIERYKDKDDLLLVRAGEVPFIIKIEDFYNNRGKWENVRFLLWNNGNFLPYSSLHQEADEIIEYQDKLKSDYEEIVKEYSIDFTESTSIAHNQDGTFASVGQDEERIGVLILKDISPSRIRVSSIGADLLFSDKISNHTINLKNWDSSESYRVSVLEFDLGLEPITVHGLERFSLSKIAEIQSLIDKASEFSQKGAELGMRLLTAAESGNLKLVEELIDKGARIDEKINGETPLDVLRRKGYTNVADSIVEGLKEKLFSAVKDNDFNEVQSLISQGVSANAKNNNGDTLLHCAARSSPKLVKYLVDGKFGDVNVRGYFKRTPLHHAAEYGMLESAKYLVKKGANVDVQDGNGQTPLYHAVMTGQLEVVKWLIGEGVCVNVEDNHLRTPLHYAAISDKLEVAKYLIEKDAKINAKDKFGKTPLDMARDRGHNNVATYLEKELNKEKNRPAQRKRRHRDGGLDPYHGHLSRTPLAVDLSNQSEVAVSNANQKSSWINDMIGWAKTSIGGLLGSKFDKTSSTTSSISDVDTQVGVDGTIILLDLLIRRVTGQKYISTAYQHVSLLEAQGYALNIIAEFEKVLNETAIKTGISVTNLNFNPSAVQLEVVREIRNGKISEISKTLCSFAKQACPEFKQTDKFLPHLRSHLEKVLAERETILLQQKIEYPSKTSNQQVSRNVVAKELSIKHNAFLNGTLVVRGISNALL